MSIKPLNLNFYDVTVQLESNSKELLALLEKDFSFFKTEEKFKKTNFHFHFEVGPIPFELIPPLVAVKQSASCLTYEDGDCRYNDYYGEALSIYNFTHESCTLYSQNQGRLHELSYLLILSRVGKALDLKGLHRIHGFGIVCEGTALVGMMPMKGGKTTLFLSLLKQNSDFEIISDDTPLVNRKGEIVPFPIRVGLGDFQNPPLKNPENIYTLQRAQFGEKKLASIEEFSHTIASPLSRVLLFEGMRMNNQDCRIEKCSSLTIFKALLKHMVVGMGLPMILEHFFEVSLKSYWRNVYILGSRLYAAFILSLRAKSYFIYLGKDKEFNAKTIQSFCRDRLKTER